MAKAPAQDYVKGRGERGSTPLGTSLFVGLRALDAFVIQPTILASAPLASIASRFNLSYPTPPPPGGALVTSLGLTPFQTVIWGMSIGSAVKQIYWLLFLSNEPMYPNGAIGISLFNTVMNGFNTAIFTAAGSNPTWSPYNIYIGSILYTIGIAIETMSEMQRKRFKDKPENEGKPYAGGLFGYARSINYFGYTVWRSAFALSAGGVWGAVMFAFFSFDFATRAIPVLENYCTKKYGVQYQEVMKKVPYRLIPGVY